MLKTRLVWLNDPVLNSPPAKPIGYNGRPLSVEQDGYNQGRVLWCAPIENPAEELAISCRPSDTPLCNAD